MLCEQCKLNQATVFVVRIVNGVKTNQYLCAPCAEPSAPLSENFQGPSVNVDEPSLQDLLQQPPNCPHEVTMSDPISVRDLANLLNVQFYQVIAVLMEHGHYKSPHAPLDFSTASIVCKHYSVTPHRSR